MIAFTVTFLGCASGSDVSAVNPTALPRDRVSTDSVVGHWHGGHGGTWPLISDTTEVDFTAAEGRLTWTMRRWPRGIAGRYEVEAEGTAELRDDEKLMMVGILTNSSELGSPGTAVRYTLRYVDNSLRGYGFSGAPQSQTLYLIRMGR